MTGIGGGDNVECLVYGCLRVTDGVLTVCVSVTIREGFVCEVRVEGRNIPAQHTGCYTLSSLSKLTTLTKFLTSRKLCSGNPDPKFLPLVAARKGKFLDKSGNSASREQTDSL